MESFLTSLGEARPPRANVWELGKQYIPTSAASADGNLWPRPVVGWRILAGSRPEICPRMWGLRTGQPNGELDCGFGGGQEWARRGLGSIAERHWRLRRGCAIKQGGAI